MEKVWAFMIISSLIVSIFNGNVEQTIKEMFEATKTATNLFISILGILSMWSGFMKIAERSGLIKNISKVLKPLIKLLFPDEIKDEELSGQIALNMSANMLGIGNVATPIGLKVMEKMQEKNKNKSKLSNSMLMFVVLNMASIQLIPTTVIALRANYNSENPTSIIIPTAISSVVSVAVGIIIVKILAGKERKWKLLNMPQKY